MPPSDVMKTPVLQDVSALRRCNPPALRLPTWVGLWPAIGKRSLLGFRFNLMSIPIELARLPVSCCKDRKKNEERRMKREEFAVALSFFNILHASPSYMLTLLFRTRRWPLPYWEPHPRPLPRYRCQAAVACAAAVDTTTIG